MGHTGVAIALLEPTILVSNFSTPKMKMLLRISKQPYFIPNFLIVNISTTSIIFALVPASKISKDWSAARWIIHQLWLWLGWTEESSGTGPYCQTYLPAIWKWSICWEKADSERLGFYPSNQTDCLIGSDGSGSNWLSLQGLCHIPPTQLCIRSTSSSMCWHTWKSWDPKWWQWR